MTKWETVKVSIIPSSYVSGFDCCILDHLLAYREDLDCLWIVHIYHRFFSELAGWRAAISVNSVVGAHFLVSRDFSFYSVCNELILALIGITAALLLNLFYDYNGSKKSIIANMCYRRTSSRWSWEVWRLICLTEMQYNVWDKICGLENVCRDLSRMRMNINPTRSILILDIILIILKCGRISAISYIICITRWKGSGRCQSRQRLLPIIWCIW